MPAKSRSSPNAQTSASPTVPARGALPAGLRKLDDVFRARWNFGSNALVGWTSANGGIAFISAPALQVFRRANDHDRIVLGRRRMGARTFAEVARALEVEPERFAFPRGADLARDEAPIEALLRRYAVTKSRERAAFLVDIAGFSLFTAKEQAAQLSILDYSLNIAEEGSAALGIATDLGRSTTGDGFYVWNRTKGVGADVNLFCVLMLALAHQALQHRRIEKRYVPIICTCFGRGSHYSFNQHGRSEPAARDYIVGDVTIGLARLVDAARPNQILISETRYGEDAREGLRSIERFLLLAGRKLKGLKNIELDGSAIQNIATYLTGPQRPRGGYGVSRLEHRDKDGFLHLAYNAKVNLSLADEEPIYLGLQESKRTERPQVGESR